MKTTLRVLALAAVAASGANGATVSYNDSMFVTEAATNTLNLTKFDSSLGTLTNVQITVTLSVPSFSMVVDNDSNNSANVTVNFGTIGGTTFTSTASTSIIDINILDVSLTGSNFTVTTQSSNFTVGAQDSDPTDTFDNDLGPDNGTFTTSPVFVGQTTVRNIHSSVWAQWTGAGTVDMGLLIDFVTDLNLNSGGGGGETRFQGTIPSATYSAEVTYTYDVIPEPSAALLGGLGALALLRRRRC